MEYQLEVRKTLHQNVESMTRTFCDYLFTLIIKSYKTCILSHPKKPKNPFKSGEEHQQQIKQTNLVDLQRVKGFCELGH